MSAARDVIGIGQDQVSRSGLLDQVGVVHSIESQVMEDELIPRRRLAPVAATVGGIEHPVSRTPPQRHDIGEQLRVGAPEVGEDRLGHVSGTRLRAAPAERGSRVVEQYSTVLPDEIPQGCLQLAVGEPHVLR